MRSYTVVKGDNLTSISRKFGVSLTDVKNANPQIADPNLITPGQIINIPDSQAQTPQDSQPSQGNYQPPKKFIKYVHGKAHTNYAPYAQGQNGIGTKPLQEPVPQFFARPGDAIISPTGITPGTDNNTMIILGRDRSGVGEVDGSVKRNRKYHSGFSDCMAAGAIDIVVGRGAPYPLNIANSSIGPMYTTKRDIPELLAERLTGVDPNNQGTPFSVPHPGYAMDAARIYISQMTAIDEYFHITKKLTQGNGYPNEANIHPASAIMLKSDKVRLHARQDIKIVTGGQNEKVNSQGVDINTLGGIHLIAGNEEKSQQPIPRGDNLVRAFHELSKIVKELSGVLFSFVNFQIEYNKVLGTHHHHTAFGGMISTPSVTAMPACVATVLSQYKFVAEQTNFIESNISKFEKDYLSSNSSDKKNKYINSIYNTTN